MNTAIAFIISCLFTLAVGVCIGWAMRDSFKGQNMSILRVDGVDEQPAPNRGLVIDPSKSPPPNMNCLVIDTTKADTMRVPNCDAAPSSMPHLFMDGVIKKDGHPVKLLGESLRRLASGEFDGRLREMDDALRVAKANGA